MSRKNLTKFYFIPKERIVNLLNSPTTFNPDGSITCHISLTSTFTLFDFAILSNIIITPAAQQYVGKLGTRGVIDAGESVFNWEKSKLDKVLQQYEL